MKIGHLALSENITPSEEQLVILVEALSAHGIEQHAIVRNPQLASRLAACHDVSVGPLARSHFWSEWITRNGLLLNTDDKCAANHRAVAGFRSCVLIE